MISEKDVKYVASLSRIHLNEEEAKPLAKDLEKILNYVAKLQKLDVKQIAPTSHVLPLNNVFREDIVRPSLTQEETLNMTVDKMNGSFKVPKVIE
ncbi:MAG: Asp-tRNA(Asn)/Glu-tRNA(Gln) amidotransferase subunit GatC [Candidatus Omnitrophica bacterium]|nr:Asp-tRNA(Asn)/Glu-tRNA(Gln) amidotransferase subunit GatC [Candidatus Omnitrophota bacterium]